MLCLTVQDTLDPCASVYLACVSIHFHSITRTLDAILDAKISPAFPPTRTILSDGSTVANIPHLNVFPVIDSVTGISLSGS